jgi:hypothetical protein
MPTFSPYTDDVKKATYDANSVLIATADNTPIALVLGASTILGRQAAGDIVALTGAEALTITGGAAVDQTMYIGTTQVAINRATAPLTLAGITLTAPVLGTATGTALDLTVANTGNDIPLTVTQNDTTNNPDAATITQNGSNNALVINTKAGSAINMAGTSATVMLENINGNGMTSGTITKIYSNSLTDGHQLDVQNNNANQTGWMQRIYNAGASDSLFVDQNGNGYGWYVDKDCTVNNTRTWAAKIDSDNAGTGTALGCGIDMSSFSVDEPLFKVVADAGNTAGTLTGQIAIDVAGTTYYVYYYTTSTVV